ncbi:MAG: hypothetical protein RJB38_974 [Pseudomonadota bacterium]|jgi:signal transduction histidine kinase
MKGLKQRSAEWIQRTLKLARLRETAIVTCLAAASLTAVLSSLDLFSMEAAFYDFRVRTQLSPRPHPEIVQIAIDETSFARFQEISPLSTTTHAAFLKALARYSPRSVGYLVNLNRSTSMQPPSQRLVASQSFLEAVASLEGRGIPLVIGTAFDVTGEVVPPYPLSTLPHGLAFIHKDGNSFSEDKITRRALAALNDRPSFHLLLAGKTDPKRPEPKPRGTFRLQDIDAEFFYFRYRGNPTRSRGESPQPYPVIAFQDVLDQKVPPEALEGKILLVGTVAREDSTDFAFSPYSKDPLATPKLTLHSMILDSVLQDDALIRAPNWMASTSTWLTSAMVIAWVLGSNPLIGLLATAGVLLLTGAISWLAFQSWGGHGGLWIETAHPTAGILVSYYLAVPYRLIREYRKRWEYQRKHQLLVEVEELKTNFLSLVTHDLKTPVARIQGLAEVLLMKASLRLTDRDQESVRHIISSTEELNRFISSILELARIESDQVMLRLESKDINALIEKCAETFKAPARAKNCKIELDLEPLFPIRFDPSLIQKVLHNLVDNAIKYGTPGSMIRLVSRDLGEWVEVRVQDQGIGMTESEREHLFKKFYRAKNEATASVGGSGLGLYLSKYFVEAHFGEVRVDSVRGHGSTFTLRLRSDLTEAAPLLRRTGKKPGLSMSQSQVTTRREGSIHSQGEPQ